jgi:crotonobetainyl-CoA:carnitine CoA-transferase CaiB-like acyl-CoA transferase
LASEQVRSLNLLEEAPQPNGETLRMIGFPWQFSNIQPQVRSAPPRLGADTAAVLQELGWTAERCQALRQQGVVGMR